MTLYSLKRLFEEFSILLFTTQHQVIPMPSPPTNRCPKCGLKWRKCQGHLTQKSNTFNRFHLFCLLCVACLITLIALNEYAKKATKPGIDRPTNSVAQEPATKSGRYLRDLEISYYQEKRKTPDSWWLNNLPRTPEDPVFQQKLNFQAYRVKNTLNRFRKVNPLAGSIRDRFEKFRVSVFVGGNTSIAIDNPETLKDTTVEICFVARIQSLDLRRQIQAPSSLYWRSDWGLFMDAIDMPEQVFSGLLFHELGHGFRHGVSLTGAGYFTPESDAYAAEEIEMHQLETAIFNEASSGAFNQIIDQIVSRKSTAKTVADVLEQTTLSDLHRLDESLSAEKVGLETASLLFAHYLIAIGANYIDTHTKELNEKIKLFRWLHQEVLDVPVRLD